MTWAYRARIRRFTFLHDLDFDEITVPSARNLPAVGSILYDPNEVLTCIQTTIHRNTIVMSRVSPL